MFCSNCGNELRQGLKYCNRCGAITTAELEKTVASPGSSKIVETLAAATGGIGAIGMIALAVLISRLLRLDDIKPPAFLLVLVFSLMLFGIICLLIRQISKLSSRSYLYTSRDIGMQERGSLPHTGNTAQLEPPRVPIGSVTDHTTRIFEENFAEKTKN
ncbi:MAG: zinc ribbon domain-containing protein [Acidobacteriota bacterium]|nr:zinc ribbon domain-containing protein [Acidobacteriota bacterium]